MGEVASFGRRRQPDSRRHEEEQLRETGECERNRHPLPAARHGPLQHVKPKLEEQKPGGLVCSLYFEGNNSRWLSEDSTSGFQNKGVLMLI